MIQRVSASPGSVFLPAPVGAAGCTPTTTTIVVLVKASGKVTGTASWSPDGGKTSQRVRLSRDGNVLTGSIGEWSVAGTDVVQVVVQDEYGKDSGKTAVTVQRCTRG
ncbi:MAG: hypothetical protein HY830_14475 [Actinobacteria bacterium]|nr:hypothetical protein [Actinomycetota bacterium]